MLIIETERTIIREFTIEDVQQAYPIYSDLEVMQFIGDGKGFSKNETEIFLKKMINRYKTHGFSFWAIESKENCELLGHCGVMLDKRILLPELGYTVSKKYWNLGFAYESSKAVLNYSFENLGFDTIVAYTKKINYKSHNLMRKLNMRHWKDYSKSNIDYVAFKIDRESK